MPYQGVMTNCTHWQVRGSSRPSNHQRPLKVEIEEKERQQITFTKEAELCAPQSLLCWRRDSYGILKPDFDETGEKRNAKGTMTIVVAVRHVHHYLYGRCLLTKEHYSGCWTSSTLRSRL